MKYATSIETISTKLNHNAGDQFKRVRVHPNTCTLILSNLTILTLVTDLMFHAETTEIIPLIVSKIKIKQTQLKTMLISHYSV